MVEEHARGARTPVGRAFRVLGWMAAADGADWALGEVARGVGMHPSTVHRVLGLLEHEGLVTHDPVAGRYGLGLEFLRLAWTASSHHDLRDVALPWLRGLSAETQETAWLGLYEPSRKAMMFAAAVESPQLVRHVRPLGEWLPVHGGASGRAILAFLPEGERSEILAAPLPALTERTITDPERLAVVLDGVRRRGYAVSRGERAAGGVGVAAPVLDDEGRVLGVVGVGLPEQRFRARDEARLAALVRACAARVAEAHPGG